MKKVKLVKVSNKTVTSTRSTTHTLGMEDSAISAKSEKSMHRFRVNILLLLAMKVLSDSVSCRLVPTLRLYYSTAVDCNSTSHWTAHNE